MILTHFTRLILIPKFINFLIFIFYFIYLFIFSLIQLQNSSPSLTEPDWKRKILSPPYPDPDFKPSISWSCIIPGVSLETSTERSVDATGLELLCRYCHLTSEMRIIIFIVGSAIFFRPRQKSFAVIFSINSSYPGSCSPLFILQKNRYWIEYVKCFITCIGVWW